MAGDAHVWRSVMSMLDPGEDVADADMRRMDKINKELHRYHYSARALLAWRRGLSFERASA